MVKAVKNYKSGNIVENVGTYKKESTITKHNRVFEIEIFIAVFFSSMLGAQLFGVSLNKIALIPLEVSLMARYFRMHHIKLSKPAKQMFIWYAFMIVSSIMAFRIYTELDGFYNGQILNIIQIIIFYIPLLSVIQYTPGLRSGLEKAILLIAKIQGVWGLAQFALWHIIHIDLNKLIFIDVFKGIFGTQWVAWYFDGISTHLRVTGLNHDPAYLALILMLGFCYEKKTLWKIFYLFIVIIASSRSGIICLVIIWIYQSRHMNRFGKIKKKYITWGTVALLVLTVGSYIVYTRIPSVRTQIDLTISRFMGISVIADDGSSRHLLYIIVALEIWLFEFGFVGKLFGIGPRAGGTAITMSRIEPRFTLNSVMKSRAWTVECDIAEILLGNGILGIGILYNLLFKIYKKSSLQEKMAIIGIIIMGFMYDIVNTTLIQFFLLCCIGLMTSQKE